MVDKRTFETNIFVPPLLKILVADNEGQESLLSGWMKTTITRVLETRVERLINNVVFQIKGAVDTSTDEFTHHYVSPFVGRALLL